MAFVMPVGWRWFGAVGSPVILKPWDTNWRGIIAHDLAIKASGEKGAIGPVLYASRQSLGPGIYQDLYCRSQLVSGGKLALLDETIYSGGGSLADRERTKTLTTTGIPDPACRLTWRALSNGAAEGQAAADQSADRDDHQGWIVLKKSG
jgi:hypothetical protein